MSHLTTLGLVSFVLLSNVATAATIITYDLAGDGNGVIAGPFSGIVSAVDYDPRTAVLGQDGDSNTITGFSVQNTNVYMRATGTQTSSLPGSGTEAYHTFGISVSGLGVNEVLDLTSVTFDYEVTGTTTNTGFYISFFSDAVGFDDLNDRLANENWTSGVVPVTVDLTSTNTIAGSTFTGLTNGSDIQFRIYFGDDGTNEDSTSAIHRIRQDLVISGDTRVIPEPQTYALIMGALACGLLLLRRRK